MECETAPMSDVFSPAAVRDLLTLTAECADEAAGTATQVALARNGELLAFETFGRAHVSGTERESRPAERDTLFAIYSVTKAVTAAASWILLQEGKLRLDERVAERIPEFASHGKQVVTVEQLLTHTAGFPNARLPWAEWADPARRLAHFASWELEWPPGSRFVYHGLSGMWVLAELITRVSGTDYREFIREQIFEPLGLENFYLGLPASKSDRVAAVVPLGEPMSADEKAISPVDAPALDDETVAYGNLPENRAVGSPGGGGIATALDVALFYQGILADAESRGIGIWRPAMLRDAWTIRNAAFVDGITGQRALRGLGVVMAGDSGKIWRGFADGCSSRAFGHMGAGGQISWADPESGLSFVFLTSGAQRNPALQGVTGLRLSTLAAACVAR
jgi:CubicO group peptidase (beta-lactamase class C family)